MLLWQLLKWSVHHTGEPLKLVVTFKCTIEVDKIILQQKYNSTTNYKWLFDDDPCALYAKLNVYCACRVCSIQSNIQKCLLAYTYEMWCETATVTAHIFTRHGYPRYTLKTCYLWDTWLPILGYWYTWKSCPKQTNSKLKHLKICQYSLQFTMPSLRVAEVTIQHL